MRCRSRMVWRATEFLRHGHRNNWSFCSRSYDDGLKCLENYKVGMLRSGDDASDPTPRGFALDSIPPPPLIYINAPDHVSIAIFGARELAPRVLHRHRQHPVLEGYAVAQDAGLRASG